MEALLEIISYVLLRGKGFRGKVGVTVNIEKGYCDVQFSGPTGLEYTYHFDDEQELVGRMTFSTGKINCDYQLLNSELAVNEIYKEMKRRETKKDA